ncbi:MAG: hypothetical protein OXD40_04955 [bacterium]|nr:hypothetical protein [bacterium]
MRSSPIACAVHRLGDLVTQMAYEVFLERHRMDFASGPPLLRCQAFRAFENVVGN